MSKKPVITARHILAALAETRRRGCWPLFQWLEHHEPDLAEHVLEELTRVHRTLVASGAPPKITRRLQRQIQRLILVVVIAVRGMSDPPDSSTEREDPP